ncbi:MAG TPA: FGGY-family carbohydrate kinase [Acidimicrobiales bacterium]|nr:FGGY-family carbohydrate kinase [Acidimicrobiales bacterium]
MTDQSLVVDVGTSGVRAAVIDGDARVTHLHHESVLPSSPMPGFVEFDAAAMARAVLTVASAAAEGAGAIAAVGITNQRASTVVWDLATGEPVGPGVGWQDLRTVAMCLMLQAQGIRVAPNVSATKLAFLLDMADPDRSRNLCFGTVDSWVAWTLSGGSAHVIDATNAAVTGLVNQDATDWDDTILDALRIPRSVLPTIVDSSGECGSASALPGAPPIAGLVGDQQGSLIGQGCVHPGTAKITFGTGGMLDLVTGDTRPTAAQRSDAGCFPIVAWRRAGRTVWGLEAAMLSAGTCVEWLRDDLGLIDDAAQSDALAASVPDSGDVWFVPALLGLGAPYWDFGARGTLLGLTRGSTRAHVVRAVLEGVAHRGADLIEAAEADSHTRIDTVRVDGGMSANATFVQALADASGRPVEVSPEREATTLGAAYLAGLAVGTWKDEEEIAARWNPAQVVEPTSKNPRRDRWAAAVDRAKATVPELSALDF